MGRFLCSARYFGAVSLRSFVPFLFWVCFVVNLNFIQSSDLYTLVETFAVVQESTSGFHFSGIFNANEWMTYRQNQLCSVRARVCVHASHQGTALASIPSRESPMMTNSSWMTTAARNYDYSLNLYHFLISLSSIPFIRFVLHIRMEFFRRKKCRLCPEHRWFWMDCFRFSEKKSYKYVFALLPKRQLFSDS